MTKFARAAAFWLLVILALTLGQHASQAAEQRFALVIGNDEYRARNSPPRQRRRSRRRRAAVRRIHRHRRANLDQATLRESFANSSARFQPPGRCGRAGYLAGIGLQFNGENYFVPVDADMQRDVDIPLQAIRVSDFTQPLASLPGRVKIVILDAARQNPFAAAISRWPAAWRWSSRSQHGDRVQRGAGHGRPDEQGPYGAYATSLTEMIAAGGLGLDDLFARLRLRVSDLTQGAEIPWYASQIDGPFFMTELAAGAPPPPNVMPIADVRAKPIRDFPSVDDAYAAALDRDTIDGYQQFLAVYPSSPYSARVAGMLAVRREAIIWRRCVSPTRRRPIGRICAAIRTDPMSGMRGGAWRCCPRPTTRRPISPITISVCRRRRRTSRLCRPAGHHLRRAALRAAAAAAAVLPAAAAT